MITDAKLFEQIEIAFAAGDTVYLVDPQWLPTTDLAEIISNSQRINIGRLDGSAVFIQPANYPQMVRASLRYAQFKCEACSRSCRDEYYMLRPKVWRKARRSNYMLCIGCVEKRLGRKVAPADFNLEQTLALAKVWQPSQRLKQRLGHWL